MMEGLGYGYKGNIHVRCWHCGFEKAFHARYEMEYFKCEACGKKTSLDDMRTVYLDCECGNHARYVTNAKTPFDLQCYNCKQPVAMYPIKSKYKNNIFVSAYSLELREEKRKKGKR